MQVALVWHGMLSAMIGSNDSESGQRHSISGKGALLFLAPVLFFVHAVLPFLPHFRNWIPSSIIIDELYCLSLRFFYVFYVLINLLPVV
jgi:hypothetical protein